MHVSARPLDNDRTISLHASPSIADRWDCGAVSRGLPGPRRRDSQRPALRFSPRAGPPRLEAEVVRQRPRRSPKRSCGEVRCQLWASVAAGRLMALSPVHIGGVAASSNRIAAKCLAARLWPFDLDRPDALSKTWAIAAIRRDPSISTLLSAATIGSTADEIFDSETSCQQAERQESLPAPTTGQSVHRGRIQLPAALRRSASLRSIRLA
jgi:hypothetical protein